MFKKMVTGIKDIKRLDEIIHVLLSEGFGFLIKTSVFSKNTEKKDFDAPKKLKNVLERLGPTFVKFGQLLSVRPDLVPMKYIRELESLQDNVKPFPFSEAKKIIEDELNKKISTVFKSIDPKPIASASISQVHKAVLKNNKKVAIKIQRPGIKEIIDIDIDIMYHLAKTINKHYPPIRKFEPVKVVDEFSKWTKKELSFRNELRNIDIFYENFKGSKTVTIPYAYEEFSTEKILITEFLDGYEIHDIKKIKNKKINVEKLVKNGLKAILTQVFEHGFFHADPHPGNIMVLKNGKIAFVDFGIVGHFNSELKKKSIDLFVGIINDDVDMIVNTFLSLSTVERPIDMLSFKSEISEAIFPLQAGKLKDVHVSYVLEKVLDIALKHGIKMPIDLVLLGKTILTIEGVAIDYAPNFNIVETTRPYVKKLMMDKIRPKNLIKNLSETSLKYKDFLEDFPGKAGRVLDNIAKGSIKVDIEDTDINKLTVEIGRSSNRIAYGLVIAALVVGSAITLTIQENGTISFIAKAGFVLAMVLGIILIYSILIENKENNNNR